MSRRTWLMGGASLIAIASTIPNAPFDPLVEWETIPTPGKPAIGGRCPFSKMPQGGAGYFRLLSEREAA